MLSLEQIVNDTEHVRERLVARGEDPPLDEILELDVRRRGLVTEADSLRARRNEASRAIGQSGGKPSDDQIADMREVGDRIKSVESELDEVEAQIYQLRIGLPNLPLQEVPVGPDESANVLVREHGEPVERPYEVEPHWESAVRLGIIDFEAGARMSGTRFYVLRGAGARLQHALTSLMLDVHTQQHGYLEIAPPVIVRGETMTGAGNLPKFADDLFHDGDMWFIPSAEAALASLHAGEIIEPGVLPLKYVARTPCFRKEHAAAGRDTRGIKRVRQFEKVEMFRFTEPEESEVAFEEMVGEATAICELLGLTYRVVELPTGDISFQAARTFDIEVWAPGSKEWLEVSSVSTCTDFQARRTNTRYRPAPGAAVRFPHMLNGSGLGIPRVLIALIENGQEEDGSVTLPEALQPYTGFDRITGP